jgi:hypothetical protein
MEVICEYIEYLVAKSRQGVVLQLGSSAWGLQILAVKKHIVTKCFTGPRSRTVSLDEQPKLRKMDMRLLECILERWDRVVWTGLISLRIGTSGGLL